MSLTSNLQTSSDESNVDTKNAPVPPQGRLTILQTEISDSSSSGVKLALPAFTEDCKVDLYGFFQPANTSSKPNIKAMRVRVFREPSARTRNIVSNMFSLETVEGTPFTSPNIGKAHLSRGSYSTGSDPAYQSNAVLVEDFLRYFELAPNNPEYGTLLLKDIEVPAERHIQLFVDDIFDCKIYALVHE